MKRVKALKHFFDEKTFGKDGIYEVPDKQARRLQTQGRVKVLEDLGNDETSVEIQKDFEFLQKVRDHASDILEILMDEGDMKKTKKNKSSKSEQEKTEKTGIEDSDENKSDLSNEVIEDEVQINQENQNDDSNEQNESDLPEDLPHRELLISSDFDNVEKLNEALKTKGKLSKSVKGIGERIEQQIAVKMKKVK